MSKLTIHDVGIIMNGVTGRMGLNQHLRRSISAIRKQGGIQLSETEVILPKVLLVGRNPQKLEAISAEHENCPHLNGYGGTLNLRRLRFEPATLLCKCACHSSCPLTGKRGFVREQTWHESCTCSGAEDERPRRDPGGLPG